MEAEEGVASMVSIQYSPTESLERLAQKMNSLVAKAAMGGGETSDNSQAIYREMLSVALEINFHNGNRAELAETLATDLTAIVVKLEAENRGLRAEKERAERQADRLRQALTCKPCEGTGRILNFGGYLEGDCPVCAKERRGLL
jgi:hypothetical protein